MLEAQEYFQKTPEFRRTASRLRDLSPTTVLIDGKCARSDKTLVHLTKFLLPIFSPEVLTPFEFNG